MKKMTFHLIALLLAVSCLLTLALTSCGKPTKVPPSSGDSITPIGGAPTGINIVNDDGTPVKDAYAITATVIEIAKDRSWFVCNYDGYRVVVNDELEDNANYTKGCQVEVTYRISDLSIKDNSYVIDRAIHICIKQDAQGEVYDKPVIYLYPEQTTTVDVTVDFKGAFTVTIPEYKDGWTVTAHPDGTLIAEDGKTYPYLFWEGIPESEVLTLTEGFCVRGEDTETFLLDILPRLGLIEKEYTEFIDFWLPRMEGNAYNVIRFNDPAYMETATMNISPAPDTVIRVFMSFTASESYVELPEQHFDTPARNGFTAVEWGGCELK